MFVIAVVIVIIIIIIIAAAAEAPVLPTAEVLLEELVRVGR